MKILQWEDLYALLGAKGSHNGLFSLRLLSHVPAFLCLSGILGRLFSCCVKMPAITSRLEDNILQASGPIRNSSFIPPVILENSLEYASTHPHGVTCQSHVEVDTVPWSARSMKSEHGVHPTEITQSRNDGWVILSKETRVLLPGSEQSNNWIGNARQN